MKVPLSYVEIKVFSKEEYFPKTAENMREILPITEKTPCLIFSHRESLCKSIAGSEEISIDVEL